MKTQLEVEIPVLDLDAQDVALTFFAEVWNARGEVAWSKMGELVADDYHDHTRLADQPGGRSGLAWRIEQVRRALADLSVSVEETRLDGSRVTICWSGLGFRRDPTTGATWLVRIAGLDTLRICHGRIVAGWHTWTFSRPRPVPELLSSLLDNLP